MAAESKDWVVVSRRETMANALKEYLRWAAGMVGMAGMVDPQASVLLARERHRGELNFGVAMLGSVAGDFGGEGQGPQMDRWDLPNGKVMAMYVTWIGAWNLLSQAGRLENVGGRAFTGFMGDQRVGFGRSSLGARVLRRMVSQEAGNQNVEGVEADGPVWLYPVEGVRVTEQPEKAVLEGPAGGWLGRASVVDEGTNSRLMLELGLAQMYRMVRRMPGEIQAMQAEDRAAKLAPVGESRRSWLGVVINKMRRM